MPEELSSDATTGLSIHSFIERVEEAEERKRILYVACTRAADYLILSSSIRDLADPKGELLRQLGDRFNFKTGALIENEPAGLSPTRIRVDVQQAKDQDRKRRGGSRLDLMKLVERVRHSAREIDAQPPATVVDIAPYYGGRRQFAISRFKSTVVPDKPDLEVAAREDRAKIPGTRASPESLGRLVHSVLQYVRFDDCAASDVESLCHDLALKEIPFDAAGAAGQAADMVGRFLQSPRARAMAAARALHRELEFQLGWPPGKPSDDGPFFQGYIDAVYIDADGRWRLVDYKSGEVRDGNYAAAAATFELQLGVYALAMEHALGVRMEELVVCFLRHGAEHPLQWNDARRAKVVANVDQQIAAYLNPVARTLY